MVFYFEIRRFNILKWFSHLLFSTAITHTSLIFSNYYISYGPLRQPREGHNINHLKTERNGVFGGHPGYDIPWVETVIAVVQRGPEYQRTT